MFERLKNIVKGLLLRTGVSRGDLSEEELKLVIDAGTLSGAIDKTEHELIRSILEFSDITVKEIMVPRPDIVALDLAAPQDQIIHRVIEEGYSRYPVYRGTLDTVVGVMYTKDLLSLLEHRNLIILQDIVRPPLFVPESKKISQLLREFQSKKMHLGVVVDEFGGTEGIVTMEDIIEEIVGEIHDEYDEISRAQVSTAGGWTFVDATMHIDAFNEQFSAAIPEDPDYETIAGFIQKASGRLPSMGEEIRFGDLVFVIAGTSKRRIKQIKFVRFTPPEPPSENAE